MASVCDIAVLGATPAGFAAATRLAGRGCDVIVLDTPAESVQSPLSDWVPGDFFRQKGLPSGLATAADAKPFQRVLYHSADMARDAEYSGRSVAGYLLHHGSLLAVLREVATDKGVKVRRTNTRPTVELDEDEVRCVGTCQVRAQLAIVAQDRPDEVVAQLSLPIRSVPRAEMVIAGMDIPLRSASEGQAVAGAVHVIQSREQSEMGLFFLADPRTLHVRVLSTSAAHGTRARELSALINTLQVEGTLPTSLRLDKATGAVWHPPAGGALDLETHVAKRCLLAGTAGGFADSITGQVLAPSVRSAILAADAAADALRADDPQQALKAFETAWREDLAALLRPPNTPLQMLLPLLFVNERMVSKFTEALLYGEPI